MNAGDMQAWCHYNFDVCDAPAVIEINESQYFKPKPASAMVAPAPSGQNLNVLHLSDCEFSIAYVVIFYALLLSHKKGILIRATT